jgi:hypothetical protein
MALSVTRANKKPYTVRPLIVQDIRAELAEAAKKGLASMKDAWAKLTPEQKKDLTSYKDELKVIAEQAENNQPLDI